MNQTIRSLILKKSYKKILKWLNEKVKLTSTPYLINSLNA